MAQSLQPEKEYILANLAAFQLMKVQPHFCEDDLGKKEVTAVNAELVLYGCHCLSLLTP